VKKRVAWGEKSHDLTQRFDPAAHRPHGDLKTAPFEPCRRNPRRSSANILAGMQLGHADGFFILVKLLEKHWDALCKAERSWSIFEQACCRIRTLL
jgi:hypothetical protein